METYDFTEWHDDRLQARLAEVLDTDQIPHSPARREMVARELSHIVFELNCRRQEVATGQMVNNALS